MEEEKLFPVCIFCNNTSHKTGNDDVFNDIADIVDRASEHPSLILNEETSKYSHRKEDLTQFSKQVLQLNETELQEIERVSMCQECGSVIGSAVNRKCGAEKLEERVKELQSQLEALKREWEGQLKEFYDDMKRLEAIMTQAEKGKVANEGSSNPGQLFTFCEESNVHDDKDHKAGDQHFNKKEHEETVQHGLRRTIFQAIQGIAKGQDKDRSQQPVKRGRRKRRNFPGSVHPIDSAVQVKVEVKSGQAEDVAQDSSGSIPNSGELMIIPEFELEALIKEEPLDGDANKIPETQETILGFEMMEVEVDEFEPEVIDELIATGPLRRPRRKRKATLKKITEKAGEDDDNLSAPDDGLKQEDYLDTSDDDFYLDEEEIDSCSESTTTSEEEDVSSDEDDEDYGKKKVKKKSTENKGQRKKRESKSNPDSKKSRKAAYTKVLHSINFSSMSKFKRKLIQRVLHKKYRRPTRKPKTPGKEEVDDPRLDHCIEYDSVTDTLSLDGINITTIEEKNADGEDSLCLRCSMCGWTATPSHNSRHPVDSFMYNHIAGQHLNLFQCVQCGSNLGGYKQYSDHVLGHRMGFACDVCGRPLGGAQALARHKWSHLNELEASELLAKGLKDPREKKESTKIYPCPTCGKVFPQRCQLKKHEKVHAEVRERITCEICGKLFLPSGFISHKRYYCFPEGVEQPRISCPLCPKIFKNKQFMQVHMDRAHNEERNHKCAQCGKGFKTKKDLMTHEETHTTERAFSCKKGCGRTYKTRKNCNAHEKRCDGRGGVLIQRFLDAGEDRPFSCRKGCGRAYKTRRTLRGHEKTCTGSPFVADLPLVGRLGAGVEEGQVILVQQPTELTTMTVLGQALQASMEAVIEGTVLQAGVTTITTLPEGAVPEAVITETVETKPEFS